MRLTLLLLLWLPSPAVAQASVSPTGGRADRDPVLALAEVLDRHPVVGLGENHGHAEFHALLLRVLGHPRVQARLDDIAVEFGNALYQPVMDRYMAGDDVPWDSVTMAWRNSVVSPNTVWDAPVYAAFFRGVRAINAERQDGRSYRVLLADLPVDWTEIEEPADLGTLGSRTRHMADVVRRESLLPGRTSLVVAGGAHLVRKNRVRMGRSGIPTAEVTVAGWLELLHPGVTFLVQSMGQAQTLALDGFIANEGPTLVRLADSPEHGLLVANRSTTMRNMDGSPFRAYGEATLRDLVDAVILWETDQDTYPEPSAETYRVDWYWQALNRRSHMLRGQPMDETLRSGGDL